MTATLSVGLEGFTFPDLDPFALVDLAAGTRYTHVGVRLVDPATNTPTLTLGGAYRLREHAEERGIALHGADIVNLEGPVDAWDECLSILAACGVTRVSAFHRDADLTAASRRFGELVAQAREFGVTPHLEPVSYFGVNSVAAVAELVERVGGGGLTLDTLHFRRASDDLERLAEVAHTIPIWLQVCDGPPFDELVSAGASPEERTAALRHESIGRRLPPGAGACGVADIVRIVHDATPDAELVLMVEAPDHERVRRIGSAAYAGVCLNAADDVITHASSRADVA
ncbi:sugar phosphate isomerase/epimerase [Agromyces sp. Marseille-P2726]|uniref:sugar phosphate isomerase/epimerase family protein n=1 Tax=Agromyces sp. Marseille-P2726 TaxID=2709132 RepID=UPI00156D791A|nr:TIM barrel protein [Agromyces sp. Marseille-P2726]